MIFSLFYQHQPSSREFDPADFKFSRVYWDQTNAFSYIDGYGNGRLAPYFSEALRPYSI
jgi:hypothetical protein